MKKSLIIKLFFVLSYFLKLRYTKHTKKAVLLKMKIITCLFLDLLWIPLKQLHILVSNSVLCIPIFVQ